MTAVDSGVDFKSPPADYADLFRTYYGYVVGLVRRVGVDSQHADDVAAEILLKFMEEDFLTEFDPDLVFLYQGQIRPARFKSFLSRFVMLYARGFRDKQHRRAARELQVLDGSWFENAGWLDEYVIQDGHEDGVLDTVSNDGLVADIRAYLRTVPPRSQYDTCDLVALFDAITEQVRDTGTCTAAALREVFGVSSTAVYGWLRWLRVHVGAYLGQPTKSRKGKAR